MKCPSKVERTINSILQEVIQFKKGTERPKYRNQEIKGRCTRFLLESFHNGIICPQGKGQAFERRT